MKNLLYKELMLVIHPMVIVFCFFGFMLLIPSYPYLLAFMYTFVSFTFIFIGGRENNEMYYTCILPIRKRDVVRSRFITIILMELATALIAIPFAFASKSINASMIAQNAKEAKRVFMNANFTLFGTAFILNGIFNYLFMTAYYKTTKKLLSAFLSSTITVVVLAVVIEVLFQVVDPLKEIFAGYTQQFLWCRLVFFIVGFGLFALLTFLAYKKSAKEFEKIDI